MSTYMRPTVDYATFPDTDDEPMADTEDNQALMIDTIFALRHRLEPEGHHVGGNLLVYYNPASGLDPGTLWVSPDVFVALGSGSERRKKWETWIEGKFPELIIEFASPSISDRDVGEKIDLYSRLGAEEYYIFDPIPLLQPPFQAYHRVGRRLVPQTVGPEQRVASPVTGLVIEIVDGWLRVRDPATGELCPIPDEERAARIAAELAHRQAEQRAVRGSKRARRPNHDCKRPSCAPSGPSCAPSARHRPVWRPSSGRSGRDWRPRHASQWWKRNCVRCWSSETTIVAPAQERSGDLLGQPLRGCHIRG